MKSKNKDTLQHGESTPAYPQYKDSGVEWLGQVPEHWEVLPLFAVMSERQEKNEDNKVQEVLSLSYGRIIRRDVESNFGLLPESFETYQIVLPDNIILRLTDLQNDKRSLRVGLAQQKGIITSAYVCLQPSSSLDAKFAYQLLHSCDLSKVFYGLGGGVRQSMKFSDLKRLRFLLPPLPEQRAIASYLDRETARMDTLIARQERMIELAQEKRRALIGHAVTRGLDESAPLKDSGVAWLGQVPAHWGVLPLKYLALLKSGESITAEHIEEVGEYPVYGGNGLRGYTTGYTHSGEYVLIGRQGALCGNINYASGEFWASEHAVVVNPQQDFETVWMGEFLRTMNLGQYSVSAAQPGLSVEAISKLKIVFPPLCEQRAIVKYLDAETARLDTLISKARRAIELLKEHRSALIAAAVTGQIDVRS